MKICPYCSEKIQNAAKKCRYCGEWLNNEKQIKKDLGKENIEVEVKKSKPKKIKKSYILIDQNGEIEDKDKAPAYTDLWFKGKFKGRLARKDFLIQAIMYGIPSFVALAMIGNSESGDMGWIMGITIGVGVIPMLIITHIKRFHDLNFSGWWVLLELTIFGIPFVLIFLLFLKGTIGPNNYGFDQLTSYEQQKKLVKFQDGQLIIKQVQIKNEKINKEFGQDNYDNSGWDFD